MEVGPPALACGTQTVGTWDPERPRVFLIETLRGELDISHPVREAQRLHTLRVPNRSATNSPEPATPSKRNVCATRWDLKCIDR